MARLAATWNRITPTMALSLLLVLASSVLSACSPPEPVCDDPMGCIHVLPSESIQIGTLFASSGSAAPLGQDSLRAIELALDDRDGELRGRPLELVSADGGCSAESATDAIATLTTNPNLVGILGPTCATAAAAALPTVNNRRLVMMSPSITAPSFSLPLIDENSSYRPGFYRTIYDNRLQAVAAAEFAFQELRARTAVILFDDAHYGRDLPPVFRDQFEAQGGDVLLQRGIAPGQTSFTDLWADLTELNPDLIYLLLFEPEASFFLNEKPQLEDQPVPDIIAFDGLLMADWAERVGSPAAGVYVVGSAVTGPAYTDLIEKYTAAYNATPSAMVHPYAYDAANLLLDTLDTIAIEQEDGTLTIGKHALRETLTATAEYPGVTGTLTCRTNGQCASNSSLGVYQLQASDAGLILWPPPLVWQPDSPFDQPGEE